MQTCFNMALSYTRPVRGSPGVDTDMETSPRACTLGADWDTEMEGMWLEQCYSSCEVQVKERGKGNLKVNNNTGRRFEAKRVSNLQMARDPGLYCPNAELSLIPPGAPAEATAFAADLWSIRRCSA